MSKIVIKGLCKNYKKTKALADINIEIVPNKIHGLLGRNGAGKTTLLNLITNRIFPSQGQIEIDGRPVHENGSILKNIYYMAEIDFFPGQRRVNRLYKWTKDFYPAFDWDYAVDLAHKFDLDLSLRFNTLSKGYKTISKAIAALASNSPIILMDEPTLGLDAVYRDLLYKEILANYSAQPKTILLSTHLIEEISGILEEGIIIKTGHIIRQENVESLLASAHVASGAIAAVDEYAAGKNLIDEEVMADFKATTIIDSPKDSDLAQKLDLTLKQTNLQKLFIALTRKNETGRQGGQYNA